MCLGFVLPDNFRAPYAAVGFSDFWRRWHISLSTWLRDYLYIPLGGNQNGSLRTLTNLMITMLLGGLWHGASWLFVVWGGLQGLYLVIEHLLKKIFRNVQLIGNKLIHSWMILLTFTLISISWVFFRSPDMTTATSMLSALFCPTQTRLYLGDDIAGLYAILIALLGWHWLIKDSSLEVLVERTPGWIRTAALSVMLLSLVFVTNDDRTFIYFQF